MAKATFLICSDVDSVELQEIIKKKFDDEYYILRDGSQWVVSADKTTTEVFEELEAGEKLGTGLVVFLVSNYKGWHDSSFWEWMELD